MPWKKFLTLIVEFAKTLIELFVPDDDDKDKTDKLKPS